MIHFLQAHLWVCWRLGEGLIVRAPARAGDEVVVDSVRDRREELGYTVTKTPGRPGPHYCGTPTDSTGHEHHVGTGWCGNVAWGVVVESLTGRRDYGVVAGWVLSCLSGRVSCVSRSAQCR